MWSTRRDGFDGQITAVDLTSSPPVAEATIDIPNGPGNFIAISPDGRKAYMTDPQDGKVFPIDLRTRSPATVGAAIVVGGNPEGIAFSPDGSRAYVAMNANTSGAAEVLPITVATDAVGKAITGLGPHPFRIAVTPDGRQGVRRGRRVGHQREGISDRVAGRDRWQADLIGSGVTGHRDHSGRHRGPMRPRGAERGADRFVHRTGGNADRDERGSFAVAVAPDSRTVYVTNDTAAHGHADRRGAEVRPDQPDLVGGQYAAWDGDHA